MRLPTVCSTTLAAAVLLAAVALPAASARGADAVDAWIETGLADGSIAAATVARVSPEGVVVAGHGRRVPGEEAPPTGTTRFQYGSITKVFTHLLLGELVADGAARYEQMLMEALDEGFAPLNSDVRYITLLQLATHTSGLPRLPQDLDPSPPQPYAGYDEDRLVAALAATRAQQPLGHHYAYSNFGAATLAHALGRIDGTGYHASLQQRVLQPLSLANTSFQPGIDVATAMQDGKPVDAWRLGAFDGAGGLWGGVADLGRLLAVQLGIEESKLTHPLDEDLAVLPDTGEQELTRVWHVARAGEAPIYWHSGATAGFHSVVAFRPDQRRGIAVLASGGADPARAALAALGATARPPARAAIDASVFGQYAFTPTFGIGVYENDGVLVAQASGQPAFRLHPLEEDWYALAEVDASVHFLREDGAVVAIELAQNGQVQRANRSAATATAAARTEVTLEAEALAAYVGSYDFAPGVVLSVRQGTQHLEAQLTGQPWIEVYPRKADHFFYKVVDAELVFERDAEGKVAAVVLHQGGAEQRAPRAR